MEYLSTVDELVINNELIEKLLEKLAEINEKGYSCFYVQIPRNHETSEGIV